ncbi:MAG: cupin domain-containing protein [Beijerinckiaceae bacterium]|nr:cupin domain-containing protein [Beijerinckiaceae bacterium]
MRPHIDFIQAQNLPWQSAERFGFSGAQVKILSEDDSSGAVSCVLSLPGGAVRAAGALPFDEEIYILDGIVSFGAESYGEHAYGFLPNGFSDNDLSSEGPAHLLYFRCDRRDAPETDAEKTASRLVRKTDLTKGAWDGNFDKFGLGSMATTARTRVLREDPDTQETTYLTATIAFRQGERAERHPITQEFFLLSGELCGEFGAMQGGAYCFRPPMHKHAPYGSVTGAVIFFRGLGGKQETLWEDPEFKLSLLPKHNPILPDELKQYGAPAPRPVRY